MQKPVRWPCGVCGRDVCSISKFSSQMSNYNSVLVVRSGYTEV